MQGRGKHDEAEALRILMLAPEPFLEERGTLIAEIHRIHPWPRPRHIRPWFSISKVWCDTFLAVKVFRMVRRRRYDLIHPLEVLAHPNPRRSSRQLFIIGSYRTTTANPDMDHSIGL